MKYYKNFFRNIVLKLALLFPTLLLFNNSILAQLITGNNNVEADSEIIYTYNGSGTECWLYWQVEGGIFPDHSYGTSATVAADANNTIRVVWNGLGNSGIVSLLGGADACVTSRTDYNVTINHEPEDPDPVDPDPVDPDPVDPDPEFLCDCHYSIYQAYYNIYNGCSTSSYSGPYPNSLNVKSIRSSITIESPTTWKASEYIELVSTTGKGEFHVPEGMEFSASIGITCETTSSSQTNVTINKSSVHSTSKALEGSELDSISYNRKAFHDEGVKEFDQNLVNIYPNPTSGLLAISFAKYEEIPYTISIIDNTGKEVFTGSAFEQSEKYEIDLSNLPRASYFIKIITKEGVFVEQLIIQ